MGMSDGCYALWKKKNAEFKEFLFFLNAEKGIGFDCHRNILFSCFSFSL